MVLFPFLVLCCVSLAHSLMQCPLCMEIAQKLESRQGKTDDPGTLRKEVCGSYSGESSLECNTLMSSHPKEVAKAVKMSPSYDLCGDLDFCVRKETVALLGTNECTWGPRHWCSSRAVAAKCKMVKYCEEKGWN